jgi:hypothetical protein
MNNWHPEFMAEYRRQEILMEAEHIRLEKIALQARPYRPNVQCSNTPTGSFAQ